MILEMVAYKTSLIFLIRTTIFIYHSANQLILYIIDVNVRIYYKLVEVLVVMRGLLKVMFHTTLLVPYP